jgi:hypothetical protein
MGQRLAHHVVCNFSKDEESMQIPNEERKLSLSICNKFVHREGDKESMIQ